MVLKKVFDTATSITETTIHTATDVISGTVEKAGLKQTAQFVRDTGNMTQDVSKAGLYVTSHLTEGTARTLQGVLNKDTQVRQSGMNEVKDTTKAVFSSVGSMLQHGVNHTYEAVAGVVGRDEQRIKTAAKSLWKTPSVGSKVFQDDQIVAADFSNVDAIQSINELYEGTVHPITGVAFERTELLIGEQMISDVFPVFEATFTARLAPDEYLLTDEEHDEIANAQLYKAILEDTAIGEIIGLSADDIEALRQGQTPAGYTWHHHEQPGTLQLVDAKTHAQTEHVGGRVIWGGGLERQY